MRNNVPIGQNSVIQSILGCPAFRVKKHQHCCGSEWTLSGCAAVPPSIPQEAEALLPLRPMTLPTTPTQLGMNVNQFIIIIIIISIMIHNT